jgi:hypothetical protein
VTIGLAVSNTARSRVFSALDALPSTARILAPNVAGFNLKGANHENPTALSALFNPLNLKESFPSCAAGGNHIGPRVCRHGDFETTFSCDSAKQRQGAQSQTTSNQQFP